MALIHVIRVLWWSALLLLSNELALCPNPTNPYQEWKKLLRLYALLWHSAFRNRCLLTSRFSRRSLSPCMVFPRFSILSFGSLGTSPIVFCFSLPQEFPLTYFLSSVAAAHRDSLVVNSLMVPCCLEIFSFCCKIVSRSCMTVFLSSSSWLPEFSSGNNVTGQLASPLRGTARQMYRFPSSGWFRVSWPRPSAQKHNNPYKHKNIPATCTNQ